MKNNPVMTVAEVIERISQNLGHRIRIQGALRSRMGCVCLSPPGAEFPLIWIKTVGALRLCGRSKRAPGPDPMSNDATVSGILAKSDHSAFSAMLVDVDYYKDEYGELEKGPIQIAPSPEVEIEDALRLHSAARLIGKLWNESLRTHDHRFQQRDDSNT